MEHLTSFRLFFGNSLNIKVLDFFLDNPEFGYSLTQVAKYVKIESPTLRRFLPKLAALGIVKKTRRVGRAELHSLNTKNPLVRKLIELDFTISKLAVEEELKKQAIKRPSIASA